MKARASNPRLLADSDGACVLVCQVKGPGLAREIAELAQTSDLELTLEKRRKRRSRDANAYAWTLMGQLSAKLNIPPEEIYREAIRGVGDNYEIYPIRQEAAEKWKEIWRSRGIGWICEELGESKLEGYMNIVSYYGSSTYDTKQMARLIDIIVNECREQGIETMSEQELERLTRNWKRN